MAGMIDLIQQHSEGIAAICRRHRVRRLDLFGSAATGAFNPDHSDVDFLVEFDPADTANLFHRYFSLGEDLERLLGYRIDIVTAEALRNPYLIRSVNRSRQAVYESAHAETA